MSTHEEPDQFRRAIERTVERKVIRHRYTRVFRKTTLELLREVELKPVAPSDTQPGNNVDDDPFADLVR